METTLVMPRKHHSWELEQPGSPVGKASVDIDSVTTGQQPLSFGLTVIGKTILIHLFNLSSSQCSLENLWIIPWLSEKEKPQAITANSGA